MGSDSIFAIGSGEALAKNKVKFLCSHSGRIMHRPTDAKLKYVGGDTRVIAVSRHINFTELMGRLAELLPGETVLKYQILPEDLDALVSVRSDDDLKHMIEEHDRREAKGASNLRCFLFPGKPVPVENQALEQRYIDAINGLIICATTTAKGKWNNNNAPLTKSASSPDNNNNDHAAQNRATMQRSKFSMSKVQSSPNLFNLGSTQNSQIHQPIPQYSQSHNQNRYQDYSQKGGLPPIYIGQGQGQGQGSNYYYPSSTHPKRFGNGYGGKCYDDSSYSAAPPRQYENGGGKYYYDDNTPEVMNHHHARGTGPVMPPRQYGSGGGSSDSSSYEMPGRAPSPGLRLENSYNGAPEMPGRGRSPSPRLDSSPYGWMPETPNRAPSPSHRTEGSYGAMPEMPSRGRSPGPAHSSRGRSPSPGLRFE